MSPALVVFVKELRENLRDRRSLMRSLIFGPLLGPIIFVVMMQMIISQTTERAEGPLDVPVVGADVAPHLMAALEADGLVSGPAPADPVAAVRRGEADVVLVIPPGYAAAWQQGQTASVRLLHDSSKRGTSTVVNRLAGMVERYSAVQGRMRLLARGMAPDVATPVAIDRRDQATPASRAVILFAMMPYFFFIAIFVASMYLAIDLTAGERERQSLEPLFANPVARRAILAGKLGAIAVFGALGLVVSLLTFHFAAAWLPMDALDMSLSIGGGFIGLALFVMAPLVVLLAALQTLVAGFAPGFREAQTYLSLLMIVPVFASLLTVFIDTGQALWQYAVPLFGQQVILLDMLRGDMPSMLETGVAFVSTSFVAALVVAITARVYAMERLAISA